MQLDQSFRVLTENSVDVLCRIGLDLSIRYMSPSCLKVLVWPQEELAGRCLEALVVQEDRPLLRDDVALAMNAPPEQEPSTGVVMRTLRKDGTIAWIEGRGKLLRDPLRGAPEEFIAVLRDANERVELEAHLRAMAHTDGLTAGSPIAGPLTKH